MASSRKQVLLAKVETTQFTDSVPTSALNAILAKNIRVTPLRVESEDRALVRPYFGNSEQLPVMEEVVVEFDVEMAGSGTAATPAAYGPLLRACGFAEVVATDVQYNPISSAFEFVTIYFHRDGWVYKLLGGAGSVQIDMAAKKIPHYKFRFIGKYTPVTDVAIPTTPVYTAFKTPIASIPATAGTMTLDGFAAKVASFTADMAVDVSHVLWMNQETLAPIDRKPRGTITVEAGTVAAKDWFALVRAASNHVFTLTHGTAAGFMVKLDAPKAQIVDIEETDVSGTLAYRMNLVFAPNTGNDEFKITTK